MARIFHTLLAAILLLGLSTGALFAQPGEAPHRNGFEVTEPLKLDLSRLEANRLRLASGDSRLRPALDKLLARAERLLAYRPVSVMQKLDLPPSGDRHDYMSLAPYWWPDTTKPGGIPYLRRDGEVNPEVKNYPDKERLPVLCANAWTLGLAYHYSGKEAYARHAATLVRTWFLDTATRMNPHLRYGQAVKGVTQGRAEGLIETRHLIYLLDAVSLLRKSPQWTGADQEGLQAWFRAFLQWMETDAIGLDERGAKNNHGVWYDAQRMAFARFTGDEVRARDALRQSLQRLDSQMDARGALPDELARTRSLHYSAYCLQAFLVVAQLAREGKAELWGAVTPSGRSLSRGIDFLMPYLSGAQPWPWKQIDAFPPRMAYGMLWPAGVLFGRADCFATLRTDAGATFDESVLTLL
jgi:hypothetical protein